MDTLFKRFFRLTSLLLLISFLLLGAGVRMQYRRYLIGESKDSLIREANAVGEFAEAYSDFDSLKQSWHFRLGLSFSEKASDSGCFICGNDGEIRLCSIESANQALIGKYVPAEKLPQQDSYFELGTLGGLFHEECFAAIVPFSFSSGTCSGFVVSFTDTSRFGTQLDKITNIFLLIALLVLVISVGATSLVAQKTAKPIRELSEAAYKFGHGEMKARFHISDSDTEEIRNLGLSFNNMADSLENSEIRRREFVANVSHELKTPMTTISGFLDGILDGTIPEDNQRKYMLTVSNEVRRLSRLVRSMLEVSRIQDMGIDENKKTKFDICDAVTRTLLSFEQRIYARKLDVDIQIPDNGLGVFANEDTIVQVIYNLLDNAIKFSYEGGVLFVQIESDGQKAIISIANSGDTIPQEELGLIFDRFHKLDKSRSFDTEGSGLGLYIVKTIIEAHGEDISVSSRDNVTRFSFTLPVA